MADEDNPLTLGKVYPWGRSLSEYRRMLMLSDTELALNKTILDVGSGPSSFNAELSALGKNIVTSVDPIYEFTADEISNRIAATKDLLLSGVLGGKHRFIWSDELYPTVESLMDVRTSAMQIFLHDYESGKGSRYIQGSVEKLEYPNKHFDLALSSHFLLLYSTELGESFHRTAVSELCRVAKEIRIFPIINNRNEESAWISSVQEVANIAGMKTEIIRTDYEFQRGGHSLLRIY